MSVVSRIASNLAKEVVPTFEKAVVEQPGLFSKLAEVADSMIRQTMPASQLGRTLLKQHRGVTKDEFTDVLGGMSGKVTRPQVRERIRERGVKVEDVVLPESSALMSVREQTGEHARGVAQFSQYVEPGAVPGSYREMFVTAPRGEKLSAALEAERDSLAARFNQLSPKELERLQNIVDNVHDRWNDGHTAYSDIQNPIVRIRFNERVVDAPVKTRVSFNPSTQGWHVYNEAGRDIAAFVKESEALHKANEINRRYGGKRILFVEEIQGPNKENQEKMPESLRKRIYDIGVKRILAYAKENGFDGVAWTSGKMQADRYKLANVIDKIIWYDTPSRGGAETKRFVDAVAKDARGTIAFYINKEGKITNANNSRLIGKTIDKAIGEELSKKVLASSSGELQGLDIEVGGEGLKRLYDETIPGLMKKYGKGEVGKIKAGYKQKVYNAEDIEPGMMEDVIIREGATPAGIEDRTLGEVPYIPITQSTPSRYPLYAILPALLSALEGEELFKKNQPARPRGL